MSAAEFAKFSKAFGLQSLSRSAFKSRPTARQFPLYGEYHATDLGKHGLGCRFWNDGHEFRPAGGAQILCDETVDVPIGIGGGLPNGAKIASVQAGTGVTLNAAWICTSATGTMAVGGKAAGKYTVSATNGSAVVTGMTAQQTAGLVPGMGLSGTGWSGTISSVQQGTGFTASAAFTGTTSTSATVVINAATYTSCTFTNTGGVAVVTGTNIAAATTSIGNALNGGVGIDVEMLPDQSTNNFLTNNRWNEAYVISLPAGVVPRDGQLDIEAMFNNVYLMDATLTANFQAFLLLRYKGASAGSGQIFPLVNGTAINTAWLLASGLQTSAGSANGFRAQAHIKFDGSNFVRGWTDTGSPMSIQGGLFLNYAPMEITVCTALYGTNPWAVRGRLQRVVATVKG